MVMRVVKLSKLQVRAIFTTVLGVKPAAAADSLDQITVMFLLIADMLEKLVFLKPEQRTLLLTALKPVLTEPESCRECLMQLVFADGQYATWTTHAGFTDLESGEEVTSLPNPPMETIGYNLNELYRRGVLQIENRAGKHVKPTARSVEES